MALIDLNVTMDEAEKSDGGKKYFAPLPEGDYELCIEDVGEGVSSKRGRPMLKCKCAVVNCDNPGLNGRIIFHDMPLPWVNEQGEKDVGGIGILASLVKGCGLQWEGTTMDTEALLGSTFRAKIGQKVRLRSGVEVETTDEQGNTVKLIDNEIKRVYC